MKQLFFATFLLAFSHVSTLLGQSEPSMARDLEISSPNLGLVYSSPSGNSCITLRVAIGDANGVPLEKELQAFGSQSFGDVSFCPGVTVKFSVADLPPGTYQVHVTDPTNGAIDQTLNLPLNGAENRLTTESENSQSAAIMASQAFSPGTGFFAYVSPDEQPAGSTVIYLTGNGYPYNRAPRYVLSQKQDDGTWVTWEARPQVGQYSEFCNEVDYFQAESGGTLVERDLWAQTLTVPVPYIREDRPTYATIIDDNPDGYRGQSVTIVLISLASMRTAFPVCHPGGQFSFN